MRESVKSSSRSWAQNLTAKATGPPASRSLQRSHSSVTFGFCSRLKGARAPTIDKGSIAFCSGLTRGGRSPAAIVSYLKTSKLHTCSLKRHCPSVFLGLVSAYSTWALQACATLDTIHFAPVGKWLISVLEFCPSQLQVHGFSLCIHSSFNTSTSQCNHLSCSVAFLFGGRPTKNGLPQNGCPFFPGSLND